MVESEKVTIGFVADGAGGVGGFGAVGVQPYIIPKHKSTIKKGFNFSNLNMGRNLIYLKLKLNPGYFISKKE